MKYAMNQAGFPSEDFAETCAILAAAGYDGAEPNYTLDGPLTDESGRTFVRETAAEYGLSIPAVSTTLHWEYPLSSTDKERRIRGIEIGKSMIDAAAELGAEEILIVPAYLTPGDEYETAYENAVRSVRTLEQYGDEHSVDIAIENVQNNFCYSPTEMAEFVDEASDLGAISIYLDIGNGLRTGLPDRWINVLGDYISKVHVKDWQTDAHRPTYPLQGDINWKSVTNALADTGYNGWITAEIPPYESHPERMPNQLLETLQFLFEDLHHNNI